MHECEYVHECRFVGVVGAEPHVHAQHQFAVLHKQPAPDALQAGGIVAVIVLPHLPGNGLSPPGVRSFSELTGHRLNLIKRSQRRCAVLEEPLMVRVFPPRIGRIVGLADQMILDTFAHLHGIFLQIFRAAGKILVNHGLQHRIKDCDEHSGIDAGRILRLIVLGRNPASVPVKLDQ